MSSDALFALFFNLGFPILLLVGTYAIGTAIERKHFRDLQRREAKVRQFPLLTFQNLPANWQTTSGAVVTGSVVISIDYFKRFVATLRSIFGGRLKTYEPLLDRARREAVLRMTEEALQMGFDAVVNVRIETARLASARGDGKGTAGVEMLAFGTGIKLMRPESG